MSDLPLTPQLARSIEQNDVDYSIARLEGMRAAPGNPLGIDVRRFGNATGFLIQGWPDFWYGNKVLGMDGDSAEHLDEIQTFFGRHELDFRFEITPWNGGRPLTSGLHERGFCQTSFSTALYGVPRTVPESSARAGFTIREAQPGEMGLFLDLYQDGFGLPRLEPVEAQCVRAWLARDRENLHLCVALVDDVPAGIGLLYVKDGVGLLADAATLPAYRGRGGHAALIRHRINEAARRGCDLLTSFVEFGSASHRNLERAGLRVAYTKALWWRVA